MRRFLLVLLALLLLCGIAMAHPGRTDSNGGHWDHSTGEYHYHNDGSYQGGSSSGSSSSGGSSGKPSKLVTTGSVNMREGPGKSYDIITTLPEGTTVSYGGKVSENWYYVKYGLQYGWLHQNYARVTAWESSGGSSNSYIPSISNVFSSTSSEEKEPALMRTNAYTILRSEADSTSKAISMILSGKTLTYAGKTSGEWRYVRYGTTYGWIQDKHLDTITLREKTEPLNIQEKGDKPSMKTLLLMLFIGIAIGIVAATLIIKRKIEEIQRKANSELQYAKQQANREIEKVQSEIKNRRALQINLIKTMKLVDALKVDTIPDLSEGVVYANPDLLAGSYYHHGSTCSGNLNSILISKKVALDLDMKPCPHCTKYMQPEYDFTVYITENNYELYLRNNPKTIIYHSKECRHFGLYSNKHAIKLSEIKNSGCHCMICTDCHPPLNNPTIWL